jgi:hypothetical protein
MSLKEKLIAGDHRELIAWHLEFTGGPISPKVFSGIIFYLVGRNASHYFYIGLSDGKKYVRSAAVDYGEEHDEHIREVESWQGQYLGHYCACCRCE